jgi:hypothetical protein
MTRRITVAVEVEDDADLTGPLLKTLIEELPYFHQGIESVVLLEWQE